MDLQRNMHELDTRVADFSWKLEKRQNVYFIFFLFLPVLFWTKLIIEKFSGSIYCPATK